MLAAKKKRKDMKSLLLAVLVSLIKVDDVIGAYVVEVTVHSYRNPTGRCVECQGPTNRPGCCDEERVDILIDTCPAQQTCDPASGYCIRPLGSTQTSCAANQVIVEGTRLYFDANDIDFDNGTYFGLLNPISLASTDPWIKGFQVFFLIVDCSSDVVDLNCNIIQVIDAIPVDINYAIVGTSSPETTYTGLAGIAQLDVSFLVRCADGFYGQDCLTSCPNFVSCAGCGLSGFTGEFCQFSTGDCSDVHCNGNGACVDGSSACDCNPAFTGDLCQVNIDDCEGCTNSGECIDQVDGFVCECGLGFTGDFCQHDINDCEDVDCNDGQCVDEVNGFTCECDPGFLGETCENTNHCFGIACSGNGQCKNLRDTFTCICETGYTGNQCQEETGFEGESGSSVGGIAGGVAGALIGVILITLIIIVLIVVIVLKARSGSKDTKGDVNCQENPAYHRYTDPEPPGTPESGRSATDSVHEREFKNPLYSINVATEGRNSTLELEATVPPNIYDRVDSQTGNVVISPADPSESGVYYTVIAT